MRGKVPTDLISGNKTTQTNPLTAPLVSPGRRAAGRSKDVVDGGGKGRRIALRKFLYHTPNSLTHYVRKVGHTRPYWLMKFCTYQRDAQGRQIPNSKRDGPSRLQEEAVRSPTVPAAGSFGTEKLQVAGIASCFLKSLAPESHIYSTSITGTSINCRRARTKPTTKFLYREILRNRPE